ncbi:unnamed protein product [Scytosiphon promiscuus]
MKIRPWAVLIARVLSFPYDVAGFRETKQLDPNPENITDEASATARGTGTGGPSTRPVTATKKDIEAAARHCIALDESGWFTESSPLGLFEVETARAAAAPRITAATAEFVQRTGVRSTGSDGSGTVGVRLLLEVGSVEGRKDGGEESPLLGFDTTRGVRKSAPTGADVEAAAKAAAATVGGNPGEAQIAISGLAAWNLMMASSTQEIAEQARTMQVHVEIGAAFGTRGDWYTARETMALTDDGVGHENDGSNGSLLTASLDWQPIGEVWSKLDGPIVADVKVFVSAPSTPVGNEELLLLHATLCKTPSTVGSWERGPTTEAAAAPTDALMATLVPHAEQDRVRQQQSEQKGDSAVPVSSVAAAASSPSSPGPTVVIIEIEDGDWWRAHDEEAYGRGMDAVNALPRLAGWKPGDWKKRRERKRKQEIEKERRRAEKGARRRTEGEGGYGRRGAKRRKVEGDEGRREASWRGVKGVWRAIGRR